MSPPCNLCTTASPDGRDYRATFGPLRSPRWHLSLYVQISLICYQLFVLLPSSLMLCCVYVDPEFARVHFCSLHQTSNFSHQSVCSHTYIWVLYFPPTLISCWCTSYLSYLKHLQCWLCSQHTAQLNVI